MLASVIAESMTDSNRVYMSWSNKSCACTYISPVKVDAKGKTQFNYLIDLDSSKNLVIAVDI